MASFLANENVPGEAVEAARRAGVDVAWIAQVAGGAGDETVLAMAVEQQRVLVTFDKDFGELAVRQGRKATCGVVLLRPRLRSPEYLARFVVAVLTQEVEWRGNFCVAEEGRLRILPLPG